MQEESQPLTAFTTPFGVFQFRVMLVGLHGAPATFQRMMDHLLGNCMGYAAAYLDDVVIHSTTWEEHICHITDVLQKLREEGLMIQPKKCQFSMHPCSYLGHVGNREVCPEKTKVQAVKDFSTPVTKRHVRAFLGLTGYYRKFIPDYANIAAPINDLTKKTAPNRVKWTEECERSLTTLKARLCT